MSDPSKSIIFGGKRMSPEEFKNMLREQVAEGQKAELDSHIGSMDLQGLQGIAEDIKDAQKSGQGFGLMEFVRRRRTPAEKPMAERLQAGEMIIFRGISRGAPRVVVGNSKVLNPDMIVDKRRFSDEADRMGLSEEQRRDYIAMEVAKAQKQIEDTAKRLENNRSEIIMDSIAQGHSLEMAIILPGMLKIMGGESFVVTPKAAENVEIERPAYPPLYTGEVRDNGKIVIKVRGALEACALYGINAGWAVKRAAETMALICRVQAKDETEDQETREMAGNMEKMLHNAAIELLTNQLPEEAGGGFKAFIHKLGGSDIIAARTLPLTLSSAIIDRRVGGIILEMGGKGDHAYAFSASTPTLLGVKGLIGGNLIGTDHTVIIDDEQGIGIVNPDQTTLDYYQRKAEYLQNLHKRRQGYMSNPSAVTRDKVTVKLYANLEFTTQLDEVNMFNIPAIGLLRSEGKLLEILAENPNMSLTQLQKPVEEEMFRFLREVIDNFNGEAITIRDMDVAGRDKVTHDVARLYPDNDLNKFMGGLDFAIHARELHEPVLKAIFRATEYAEKKGKTVRLLVPMVSRIDHLNEYRSRMSQTAEALQVKLPELVLMIENPEGVRIRDTLFEAGAGVSIGTNDLIHFTTGIPRRHEEFPTVHPGIIQHIEDVCRSGAEKKKIVSICGEMGFDPVGACVAVLAGARILSGTAMMAPEIKEIIGQIDTRKDIWLLKESKNCHTQEELRELWMREFPALSEVERFTETPPFKIPT